MSEKNVEIMEDVTKDVIVNTEQSTETELAPLTSSSLQYFDEDVQKQILAVASQIDVRELEKVMP